MRIKFYVGNFPYSVTEGDLTDLFSPYGEVLSAKVVIDKETGRSKGFGFVEIESTTDGEVAANELNGKDFNGRNIKVEVAKDRPPGERKPFNNSRPPRDGNRNFEGRGNGYNS